MTATMNADTGRQRTRTALFLAVAMAATVGSALCFQYIGGYIPCHLCLEQRTPYYIGAPLMVLAVIASMLRAPAWLLVHVVVPKPQGTFGRQGSERVFDQDIEQNQGSRAGADNQSQALLDEPLDRLTIAAQQPGQQ